KTCNTVIPEGTKVEWKVNAQTTDVIEWVSEENINKFKRDNNQFLFTKNIFESTDYQILTSNKNKKHHEKLHYKINVIKDNYPSITIRSEEHTSELQSRE